MIVKAVTLFLIAIMVLGMFGKLRRPGRARRRDLPGKARKCPDCGGYLVGEGPCPCRKGT